MRYKYLSLSNYKGTYLLIRYMHGCIWRDCLLGLIDSVILQSFHQPRKLRIPRRRELMPVPPPHLPFDLSLRLSSLQRGFQSAAHSSLPSSSPSGPHCTSTSSKGSNGGGGSGEGGGGGSVDGSERKRAGDDGVGLVESAAGALSVSPITVVASAPGTPGPPLTLVQPALTQVLGAVRVAPTVVTNVVRPVASTPIPIASKPLEGAVALSSLAQDTKATLLIGSGGGAQQLPIAAGGGYLSLSSSPWPSPCDPFWVFMPFSLAFKRTWCFHIHRRPLTTTTSSDSKLITAVDDQPAVFPLTSTKQ